MQVVPVQAQASQIVNAQLSGQNCQLRIYQKSTGMFMDVYVGTSLIIGGVICQNLNRIVRDAYLGFIGDLAFVDTQGTDDPVYTGFGGRFAFVYYSPADLQGAS